MNWIFSRSTCTSCPSTMYPRYWIISMLNEHFSKFSYNLYYNKVLRINWMCCKCSTQILLNVRMPSKDMTTKEFVNGYKISSIILMNISRKLVREKGMANHSKISCLYLKVVFHTWTCSMVLWYPEFRSILLKTLCP